MTPVLLGLGSSLGDRRRNLRLAVAAIAAIPSFEMIRVSRPVVSRAVGAARGAFLNAVVHGATSLSPLALLDHCKRLETRLGRRPARRWADRCIDLDILLYGDEVIRLPRLVVPHVAFAERPFALVPAIEVAPDWKHPTEMRRLSSVSTEQSGGIWRGTGLGGRLAGLRWSR